MLIETNENNLILPWEELTIMRKLSVILLSSLASFASFSATEDVLGSVKVVKITQKVSVSDCQANFKRMESFSLCKVQAWTPQDTDTFLSNSDAVKFAINESNGMTLKALLVANVNGYYMFTFERRDEYGITKGISLSEATPLMNELYSKLDNGEVFWKLYRMQN